MEYNEPITEEKLLELADKVSVAENKPFVFIGTKNILKLWSKLIHDDSIKLLELKESYTEGEINNFKSWRDYDEDESNKRKEGNECTK